MDFTKLFGFSHNELLVWKALQKFPYNHSPSDLAKQLKLPRTTLNFLLAKLAKRGLAQSIVFGKRKRWKALKEDYLKSTVSDADSVIVVEGIESIKALVAKFLDAYKGERIYSIQGTSAVKESLGKINQGFFDFYHGQIKDMKIIVEGVISQQTFNLFGSMGEDLLRSHLDRATVAYVVPDIFLDFEIDIVCKHKELFVLDYKNERGYKLQFLELIQAFQSFMSMYKHVGKKVDLNKHIKDLVQTKI